MSEAQNFSLNKTEFNDNNFYLHKHNEYMDKGFTIFSEEELPFSEQEWEQIEKNHSILDYQIANVAETGEETSNVKYFRIKKSFEPNIYAPEIWTPLNTEKMYALYKKISGLNAPYMDRCQAHIYMQDGFLGRHNDAETYTDYLCTCILFLNDDYEGGEFIIYNSEENPYVLKPAPRSLLLTQSKIDHRVSLVKKGGRKNVCFFFSEGQCSPRKVSA